MRAVDSSSAIGHVTTRSAAGIVGSTGTAITGSSVFGNKGYANDYGSRQANHRRPSFPTVRL
jgi:hypothetical protein